MNIRSLREAVISINNPTSFGVHNIPGGRSVSKAQRQGNNDDGGDDAYDPFQYGTSEWDIFNLPPGTLALVYQQLALWLVQNIDHPLAGILKTMYGFNDESLEEFLTSGNQQALAQMINLMLRVLKNWGDPNLGTLDPNDPDSGPFLPDFPFRGPLTTGNIGSGPGFGGVFKAIKSALNRFLQDLYADEVEGISGHMNAWLIQMIQSMLEEIEKWEA